MSTSSHNLPQLLLNIDGQIISMNEYGYTLLGLPVDEKLTTIAALFQYEYLNTYFTRTERPSSLFVLFRNREFTLEFSAQGENISCIFTESINKSLSMHMVQKYVQQTQATISILDRDLRFSYLNEASLSFFRVHHLYFSTLPVQGLLGAPLETLLMHGEIPDNLFDNKTNTPTCVHIQRKEKTFEITFQQLVDEQQHILAIEAQWKDISQQTERDNHQKIRVQAIERAISPLVTCDAFGNVIDINSSMYKLIPDLSSKEPIGKHLDKIIRLSPSFQHTLPTPYKYKILDSQAELQVHPILGPEEQILGFCGELFDHSDEHLLKKSLLKLQNKLEQGDSLYRIDETLHSEDNKSLVRDINSILNVAIQPLLELQNALEKISEGDLRYPRIGETDENTSTYEEVFVQGIEFISSVFIRIRAIAEQINVQALELGNTSFGLQRGFSEQASMTSELTTALYQIEKQTKEHANDAQKTKILVDETDTLVQEGNERMQVLFTTIKDIQDYSQRLNTILKEIKNITFRTNILALNASIEAVGAGNHGSGFVVLAQEIQNLAQKSQQTLESSTLQLERIHKKISEGSNLATETTAFLDKITKSTSTVRDFVAHIAEGSKEQSLSIGEMNTALMHVSELTNSTNQNAARCALSSRELLSISEQFNDTLRHMQFNEEEEIEEESLPQEVLSILELIIEKQPELLDKLLVELSEHLPSQKVT